MEKKKLTEQELQSINSMTKAWTTIKMQIGDTEISKSRLLGKLDLLQSDLNGFEKQLTDKYGKGSKIDMSTGEVTLPEPEGLKKVE